MIKPMKYHAVIKIDNAPEKTKGGLFIAETTKDRPYVGVVVEVGYDEEERVSKGDRVYYKMYGGYEIEIEGEKYLIIPVEDILAKVVV